MRRSNPQWYYLALALALILPGVRALTWANAPARALDDAAVHAGKMLFTHDWTPKDPLANGGDGLGPVFNATSCAACHGAPSLGGASGKEHNVTMYTILPTRAGGEVRTGVVHAYAVASKYQ